MLLCIKKFEKSLEQPIPNIFNKSLKDFNYKVIIGKDTFIKFFNDICNLIYLGKKFDFKFIDIIFNFDRTCEYDILSIFVDLSFNYDFYSRIPYHYLIDWLDKNQYLSVFEEVFIFVLEKIALFHYGKIDNINFIIC